MGYPITLQRASAGSGKTYTLTKKFIRLLITIAKEGGEMRLRKDEEMRDALNHILAVTFTNKATDEMKLRIISSLAALASYKAESEGGRPAYLDDFTKEFRVSEEEISRLCKKALKFLLYNYSEFKVHTIDAFFQSMLRTFAYEADLPEGYEVIVDNGYLNKQVVIDLLTDIRQRRADPIVSRWIDSMIKDKERGGKKSSDIFNYREGGRRSKSFFDELCSIAEDFDKESNKAARESLERYVDEEKDGEKRLLNVYESLKEHFENEIFSRLAAIKESARKVISEGKDVYAATGYELGDYITGGKTTVGQLDRMANLNSDDTEDVDLKWKDIEWNEESAFSKSKFNTKAKRAELDKIRMSASSLIYALQDLTEAYREWYRYREDEIYLCWRHLSVGFPRAGLLIDLTERSRNYLLETGAMRLSDTNSMLSSIIGGDELSFVYERYGTRIDHFLIDEFQDTSLMQWENFLPLLEHSKSFNFENLIIGDAKQSIYRFRGADPTLITEKVPTQFNGYIDQRGDMEDENANRRSARRVVEFNNYIFRRLAENLACDYDDRIVDLYRNAVQMPANSGVEGYVEINICGEDIDKRSEASESAAQNEDEGEDGELTLAVKQSVRDTVFDLLSRGYQQREIAILVNRNASGREIIAYLRDCNNDLPEGIPMLDFVSEDSLTLSVSRAVEIVIDCFRMIQRGIEGKLDIRELNAALDKIREESGEKEGEKKRNKIELNWVDLSPQFCSYSLQPEEAKLTFQQRLERFLTLAAIEDESNLSEEEREELARFRRDPMNAMLSGMYAVTLPSLVEALAERFVPADLMQKDAIYLAALQDAIVEYCKIYPTDIGSMLKWWNIYGRKTTVVSPEGTDAITVMSIHKSKGLEFECVLLPDLEINLRLKNEWTWVEVPADLPMSEQLPDMMPICIQEESKNSYAWSSSPFAETQRQARYYNMVDQVNKAYVAMTRPVSEMYIYLKDTSKESFRSISAALKSLMLNAESELEQCDDSEKKYLIDIDYLKGNNSEEGDRISRFIGCRYSYGEQSPKVGGEGTSLAKRREKKRSNVEERMIDMYFVNSDRKILQYQPEGTTAYIDEGDDDRIDPREEGTKLHAVLERVKVASDLDKSFERMRIRGRMSREEIAKYKPILEEAIRRVEDRGWFDDSRRVFTERALVKAGIRTRRPDRVMIDSEGRLTVIDYKFKFIKGDAKQSQAHHSQVRRYMRQLKAATGAKEVEGYLWYINDGYRIERVELKEKR